MQIYCFDQRIQCETATILPQQLSSELLLLLNMRNVIPELVDSAETRGNASVQCFDEEEIDQVSRVVDRVIAQHEK